MRKLLLRILVLFAIIFSISTASAQFQWSNLGSGETEVNLCPAGSSCSIQGGVESTKKIFEGHIDTKNDASSLIQNIIMYGLSFVTIIAVIYILWAGFKIMIGGSDSNSLSDSKKTIIHVIIGILVMWLSYSIVFWVINSIDEVRDKQTAFYQKNDGKNFFNFSLLPKTHAQQTFTDNQRGTFYEYRSKLDFAIKDLEAEFKVHKKVSSHHIPTIKNLLQQAFIRLPDLDPNIAGKHVSNKKFADAMLDKLAQNLDSGSTVSEAIRGVVYFINNADIKQVQGSISVTPQSGNAPLHVSFSANNVVDPSGATPPPSNYQWWMRVGQEKRILRQGPNFHYTFGEPGTYTVFLDVISSSKNSFGYTDVLPLSTKININVAPQLGSLVLLVNGVNVSNKDQLKISPILASQGIIFDATASTAQNGQIIKTEWNFGNGNKHTHNGTPIPVREVFATSGEFNVELKLTSNKGETFSKKLQLIVKDPISTIKTTRESAFVKEKVSFNADTQLTDTRNVEYLWLIQDASGKGQQKRYSGRNITHEFEEVGSYIVTLRTKLPNGHDDSDTKIINIESRDPIVSITPPKEINTETPSTFILDASKSYDPDSNSKKDLQYIWKIDGRQITLDNQTNNGATGQYTFDSTGNKTISVSVANKFGKVKETKADITVRSILDGSIKILPEVSQIGKEVQFIAHSKNAKFFEWNFGDGSPIQSGNKKEVTHTYAKTGTYNLTLKITGSENNNTVTTIQRKVYVTDAHSPFALINISNSSNSVIKEENICGNKSAYILKRAESTTINADKSINIDGGNSNLEYTWKYMGKVFTRASFSETFKELGCYPIELTVRSKTNGSSSTTTEYIYLKNQSPELTNITTSIDNNKKDSQKIIVKTKANGAKDPDGVITSYIWYYTTESDQNEPQGIQISQKPEATFALPNITEKYYFGVIIEDNDGARVNSKDILQGDVPTLVGDSSSNIYMPLVTLSVPSKTLKVGEKALFNATATTILKNNITNSSKYSWDFDGDGKFDVVSQDPHAEWTYTKAGNYNIKLRVTHNGVSNTKYHTIVVRNELNAQIQAYKISDGINPDKLYLINTSQGSYSKADWKIGDFSSENLDSVILDLNKALEQSDKDGNIGTLTIIDSSGAYKSTKINVKNYKNIAQGEVNQVVYQSYPTASNDTIIIKDPLESLKISLFGNNATTYAIDTNTNIDSSNDVEGNNGFDGIADNDIDNITSPSYLDGSLFVIKDFTSATSRNQSIKITLYKDKSPIASKTISIVLDYIPENNNISDNSDILNSIKLNDFYHAKLNELATAIRNLPEGDRIVIMKHYNSVVENWDSDFEKTQSLIDIQNYLGHSNVDKNQKENIIILIDEILIGEAQARNEINVATAVLKNLLSQDKYPDLYEKIIDISANPGDVENVRKKGSEILAAIEHDENLSQEVKYVIKLQLEAIRDIARANEKSLAGIENTTSKEKTGGIGGTLISVLQIIGFIALIIIIIVVIVFFIYRRKRDNEDIGFQDYIIDNVFHGKKEENINPVPEKKTGQIIDPLKTYVPPIENTNNDTIKEDDISNNANNSANMPEWLKPSSGNKEVSEQSTNNINNPLNEESENNISNDQGGLPDWLKPQENTEPLVEEKLSNKENVNKNQEEIKNEDSMITSQEEGDLPDWLKSGNSTESILDTNKSQTSEFQEPLNTQPTSELPDWLKVDTNHKEQDSNEMNPKNINGNQEENKQDIEVEIPNAPSELPDWITNSSNQNQTPENYNESEQENITNGNSNESLNQETEQDMDQSANTIEGGESFSYTKSKKKTGVTPAGNEESQIPDWLISDHTNTPNIVEENTDIKEEKKKTPKPKKRSSETEKSNNPQIDNIEDSIPDWLK